MTETVRLLLVEDDEDDYLITRDLLARQSRTSFRLEWTSTYAEALEEIRHRRHDAYLIDYRLGEHTGLELVREGFGTGARAPVILLTGQDDYEIDLEASALGIADYVTKQALDPTGLERAIRYAVSHSGALANLARSEERYELATRASNDGIWDWDLSTGRIYLSHRWHAILGIAESTDDWWPQQWFDLIHPRDLSAFRAAVSAQVAGKGEHLEIECRMRHEDGSWRWILCRGLAIRGVDGTATRMAGSIADVTKRRIAEERLRHDALHDPLTGLPNRALLIDRLEQVLQRSVRDPEGGCAVMFLDLDRFKLINDSFSHAVGDQLLIATAARLSEVLRPGDTIARLGGDEFTVLLDGTNSIEQATRSAQRICDALQAPFLLADHQLVVRASIGIALSQAGDASSELLRNADIAMYYAKQRGGGSYALYDDAMHESVVSRLTREGALRQAVDQSLIRVHYQPIVDLATGRIRSLEALARWPEGWPPLAPAEFVPIAEECGLITALGDHVLRTALTQLAQWREASLVDADTGISVNISRLQLDDPTLPDAILQALDAAGLPPELLLLEITESTLMHEPERIMRIVEEVCSQGVGLHLDDFGTGYSSLTALAQFPVDALKIDRSFINPTSSDGDINQAIVRSTIALGHTLGLEVIAEGVETRQQLNELGRLGCEYGQGFLYSRPQDAVSTQAMLRRWDPQQLRALDPQL